MGPAAATPNLRRAAKAAGALALLAAVVGGARSCEPHLRAASLVLRARGAGFEGSGQPSASVREVVLVRPRPQGALRARLFVRRGGQRERAVVFLHGAQHQGMDEARVLELARQFSRSGLVVLTPQLEALARFRFDPSWQQDLRDAIDLVAARPEVCSGGVGLVGASLAGGLALRASSDPAVAQRLAFVFSVGGHHDLYAMFSGLTEPGAAPRDPYAFLLFVHAWAEHLVPAQEAPALRRALAHLLAWERPAAQREAAVLRGASRTLYEALASGDTGAVAPRLRAVLPAVAAQLDALSPRGHLASLPASLPVFLVHGASDPVVPPTQLTALVRELGRRRTLTVLRTPLLNHVTFERTGSEWMEQLRLVHLLAQLLAR